MNWGTSHRNEKKAIKNKKNTFLTLYMAFDKIDFKIFKRKSYMIKVYIDSYV